MRCLCRLCGSRVNVQLTFGKLYCLKCLPVESLPFCQQVTINQRKSQAFLEAARKRREEEGQAR